MKAEEIRTFEDVFTVFGTPTLLTTVEIARCPVVYVVASEDGRVVEYVGSSSTGFDRPFDPRHHALRDCGPRLLIAVWAMPSLSAARLLEDALIARLSPRRNRQRSLQARMLGTPS